MANKLDTPDLDERGLPRIQPGKGPYNLWYHYCDSDSVIILVHGVLSNVRECWQSSTGKYWPQLILKDKRLPQIGIYLGGYMTNFLSGDFGIRDCSNQLRQALNMPDWHGRPPAMSKQRLVFICHSLGGVVVRYLIESNWHDFQNKEVSLLLFASPSYGSDYGNTLTWLTSYFKHRVGKQLQWGSEILDDLDRRWKSLISQPIFVTIYSLFIINQ